MSYISSQTSAQLYLLVLGGVGDAGEDGHAHCQVQQQDAHLAVTVLQTQDGGQLVRNFKLKCCVVDALRSPFNPDNNDA